MNWRINVHRDAVKQLEAIPPDRRNRIVNDIRALAADPFHGLVKPLKWKAYKTLYREVSGPLSLHVVGVFLRNEGTYK